jgi:PD-(D/E)XK endonuclease
MPGNSSSRRRPPASRPETTRTQPTRNRELTTKRRGELAELAFTLKATGLGFAVSKPYGDSERYDFILDARDPAFAEHSACSGSAHVGTDALGCDAHEGTDALVRPAARKYRAAALRHERHLAPPPTPHPTLWRVQVKCSTQLLNGLYRVNAHRRTGGRAVPYLPSEVDFLVAYIIPEDTWYIIPLPAIRSATSLLFRRRRDRRPGLYDAYREAWRLLRHTPPQELQPQKGGTR